VADHLSSKEKRKVLLSVIEFDLHPYRLRKNDRRPRPGKNLLESPFLFGVFFQKGFLKVKRERLFDERTFPNGTWHRGE
jgi:hypothetical protein